MILRYQYQNGQWAMSHNSTLEDISKNLGTMPALPDGFFGHKTLVRLTNE